MTCIAELLYKNYCIHKSFRYKLEKNAFCVVLLNSCFYLIPDWYSYLFSFTAEEQFKYFVICPWTHIITRILICKNSLIRIYLWIHPIGFHVSRIAILHFKKYTEELDAFEVILYLFFIEYYYYSLMWNNFRWRRLIYILLLCWWFNNYFFTLISRSLTHYVRFLPFDCWVLRSLEDSTSYNCCWPHSLRYLNRPELNETVALLSIY